MPKHYLWMNSKSDKEGVCKEEEKHIWFKTIHWELCKKWRTVYLKSCLLCILWEILVGCDLAKNLSQNTMSRWICLFVDCSDFPFYYWGHRIGIWELGPNRWASVSPWKFTFSKVISDMFACMASTFTAASLSKMWISKPHQSQKLFYQLLLFGHISHGFRHIFLFQKSARIKPWANAVILAGCQW